MSEIEQSESSDEIFVCVDGVERGPLSADAFTDAVERGEIPESALWRRAEDSEYGFVKDLIQPPPLPVVAAQSDQRINLIVSTQEQLADGYANFLAGQDPDILDMWPCQELVRVVDAEEPRDWEARWKLVGGQLYAGRMIALKNSDIWDRLGDPMIFPDGLGNPYPPFAFGSGMRVEDVSRDEAEELGVIAKGTPAPIPRTNKLSGEV